MISRDKLLKRRKGKFLKIGVDYKTRGQYSYSPMLALCPRTPPGNCIMSVASQTLLTENCISRCMLAKIFVQYGHWTVFKYSIHLLTASNNISCRWEGNLNCKIYHYTDLPKWYCIDIVLLFSSHKNFSFNKSETCAQISKLLSLSQN